LNEYQKSPGQAKKKNQAQKKRMVGTVPGKTVKTKATEFASNGFGLQALKREDGWCRWHRKMKGFRARA